jgi:hypothetical protein
VHARIALAGALLLLAVACSDPAVEATAPREVVSTSSTTDVRSTTDPGGTTTDAPTKEPKPEPGTVPPPWLGTRFLPLTGSGYAAPRRTPKALRVRRFTLPDTVPMLPGEGYAARVRTPPPRAVLARSSWTPACPVTKDELAWIRVAFWGFDDGRHTGELMVHASVADDIVEVFGKLYEARFPMEQVVVAGPYVPGGPTTGDGNGTGGFVCRPVTGGTGYSEHAYGLAIDVNTFQNPYQRGGVVLPELASAYLDRGWVRPGMIIPGGPVVRALAAIGWEWGGDWRTLKDYQHFSLTGR